MHASRALRQPSRPCQLGRDVVKLQGRVEEQAKILQATAHKDATIDFHLFFVNNVLKRFQRREFFRTGLNHKKLVSHLEHGA